jgi:hypothetical protein
VHADLGEQVPADAVALGQRERVRIVDGEQAPQAVEEVAGVHALVQVVAQQGLVGREDLGKVAPGGVGQIGLPQMGEHHAPAVGEEQLALEGAVRAHQGRVLLHQRHQLEGVVARLAQRVGLGHPAAGRFQLDRIAVGGHQGAALPVLHLQQQDPWRGLSTTKSGWRARGPSGTLCQTR